MENQTGMEILLKRVSSEDHSIRMSMENLRIRDDTEGHNRRYQLGSSNGHVQPPDPGANIKKVLRGGQLKISENVGAIQNEVYNMGVVRLIEGEARRQAKLIEKGKKYKMALLEKKKLKLVS